MTPRTKQQWRARIFEALETTLRHDLSNGSGYLFEKEYGEPLTKKQEELMREAVDSVLKDLQCFARLAAQFKEQVAPKINKAAIAVVGLCIALPGIL